MSTQQSLFEEPPPGWVGRLWGKIDPEMLPDPEPFQSEALVPTAATPDGIDLEICPVGFSGCSEDNLCQWCDPSCVYCQNLDSSDCGPNDCMSCQPGLELVELYDDGSGKCVTPQ